MQKQLPQAFFEVVAYVVLCLHPPMEQLLLLFACFSLAVRLVSVDCDEIHMSKGPAGASRYNIDTETKSITESLSFLTETLTGCG